MKRGFQNLCIIVLFTSILGFAPFWQQGLESLWRIGERATLAPLCQLKHLVKGITKRIEAQDLHQELCNLRQENDLLKKFLSDQKEIIRLVHLPETISVGRIVSLPHEMGWTLMRAHVSTPVSIDTPVVCSEGIVGRVVKMSEDVATILLITDKRSRIPVQLERTGEHGIAEGNNTNLLTIIFHDRHAKRLLCPGDRFVTSGLGGLYPPHFPIAIVTSSGTVQSLISTSHLFWIRCLQSRTSKIAVA